MDRKPLAVLLFALFALAVGLAADLPARPALAARDAQELQVFAAASLNDALNEIAASYETATGVRAVLNLGASSLLARQIEEGAPADLFLSADEAQMDVLERQGLLRPGSRRSVLSNSLVIVVPADAAPRIRRPSDLAGPAVRALALADPRSVPAGVYARQYLTGLGLWEKVAGRVVPTENVRGALAAVASGNAEAGIVYKTDAALSRRVRIDYEVPAAAGPRISYPFAAVQGPGRSRGPEARTAAALRFLAHLGSPPALAVFRRHGFLVQAPPRGPR